jgi:hypothetical protein
MSASRPHPPAFVTATVRRSSPNALQRAATRGAHPTEGGDGRAGVKSDLSVRAPASRTGSNSGNHPLVPLDRLKHVGQHTARTSKAALARGNWMSISRPHAAASVAGHDAPLIDERAQRAGASRPKVAMSAPVGRGDIHSSCNLANRIDRREHRRLGGHATTEA